MLGTSLMGFSISGVVLSLIGMGRVRLLSGLICLLTGGWWAVLYFAAAISMGSVLARHQVKYLIPADYTGWVRIRYQMPGAPPLPRVGNWVICRFPKSGVIVTSSKLEEGWASDAYVYYWSDGREQALSSTLSGHGGMIWDEATQGSNGAATSEIFFVGTEDQFHRAGPSEDFHSELISR